MEPGTTASMVAVAEVGERELVERCRAGGEAGGQEAFRLLYERHAPEVLRFLRRMLGDAQAAEDALQESFLRAHRGLAAFDPGRPLRPWLLTIARRAAIEGLRRRERQQRALERVRPAQPEPPGGPEQAEARGLVLEAVGELSQEHREVVLLRLAHGLRLEEIAEAVEVTERTVRNRLAAAGVLLEQALRRRGLAPAEEGR